MGVRPNLAGPDNECLLEHAAPFHVRDQGHAGPVDLQRFESDPLFDVPVMIPIFVIELDEPHPLLRQTPRQQQFEAKEPSPGRQP